MTEIASFAAGCFWGVEDTFRNTKGVVSTKVGYMGGHTENPSYEDVCSDRTGHAETVQVEYDPKIISYEELLNIFWNIHDPTSVNRQGPDIGSQYRSIIFYHTPLQEKLAKESKQKLQNIGKFRGEIATEILPASRFNVAEEYHQEYLKKREQK